MCSLVAVWSGVFSEQLLDSDLILVQSQMNPARIQNPYASKTIV